MNPNPKILIKVNVSQQQMQIWLNDKLTFYYPISTALLGLGEEKESFKTPRGKHIIRAKIGKGSPIHSVFVKRRETGEIYSDSLALAFPERDWILTRILWLSGLEKGKNRLGNCDTMQRYIYIHGTHDESNIGTPKSRGCIRMRNQDIVELFELVPIGTPVFIE